MCAKQKREPLTQTCLPISHTEKKKQKRSLKHMFAHIAQPMSHPISPIISPTCITDILLCVSLAQPILPIYHAPFFLYVSRHLLFFQGSPPFSRCVTPHFPYISPTSFFWQAKQGEEWTWLQPCRHWMHSACALRFRTTGGTDCPLCRQQVLQWAVHRAGTAGLSTRKRTRASSRLDEEPLACIGDAGEGEGGGRPVTRSTRQRCGASSRSS